MEEHILEDAINVWENLMHSLHNELVALVSIYLLKSEHQYCGKHLFSTFYNRV